MSTEEQPSARAAAQRQCVRLRKIGLTILLVGLLSAGLVYWQGTRVAEAEDDLAMLGYHRAQSHQMGVLWGKSGLMTDELLASLKRPRTQAALIAGTTIALSLICFYLGRPLEGESLDVDPPDSAKP